MSYTQGCTSHTVRLPSADINILTNFCPGTPTVTYAGKTYNTVQIGKQCWLKENLDVGIMIEASTNQTNNNTIEKYCHNDDTAYCNTYGGFYQWNEAMQYSIIEGTQGICPSGWHIPTNEEFQPLITSAANDGNELKAIGQESISGNGIVYNTTGFSALLSGSRSYYAHFFNLGYYAHFWSSTQQIATTAINLVLDKLSDDISLKKDTKNCGYNIRCLKD